MRIGNPEFQIAVRIVVIKNDRRGRIRKGKVLPVDIVPQVGINLVVQDPRIRSHLGPQVGGV